MPPLLLTGDPGVGKTYFTRCLAAEVGTHFQEIHMENTSAGFVLSGSDATWSDGKPGQVFEALAYGEYGNPLVLIDEVDKASSDARYNPIAPLHALLERHTASTFADEYVALPINASRIVWIATANASEPIPAPIRSRLHEFHIPKPTPAQCVAVAKSVYEGLLASHPWGPHFEPVLADDVAEVLAADLAPRDMDKVLIRACALAAQDGRKAVIADDIELPTQATRPMGFI